MQEINSSNIPECLREHWIRYHSKHGTHFSTCPICYQSLQRHKILNLSRKNIPLYIPEHEDIYFGLTELEQLLISPVLPIIYVHRLNGYGQYQSKVQCIAFHNYVQNIASTLHRKPSDIILNISEVYRKGNVQVLPTLIRKAIQELKEHKHPAFKDVTISEENMAELRRLEKSQQRSREQQMSENLQQKHHCNQQNTASTH